MLPKLADHHRKGTALAAQVQVEHQGDHGPLEVVAHLAVAGIGIGPVELHPGLLAALAQALDLATRGEQVAAEVLAQVREQVHFGAEASGEGQELVDVAGDAFGEPETRHRHALVVVDRGEFGRAQAPHIPLVQVFVGHQLQELAIAGRCLQAGAAVNEHATVVVFEAAVAPIEQVQDEQVIGRGGGPGSHQPAAGLGRGLDISQDVWAMALQPIAGAGATLPGDPAVGHAGDGKAIAAVGPQLQGGVDQLVEIAG